MDFPLLSALIMTPVVGSIVVALVPGRRRELHLPVGLVMSLLPIGLAGVLFADFRSTATFQMVEFAEWYADWEIGRAHV